MASRIDTVQYICDQAGLGRRLTFRKMFGEYALYVDGKVVALICDDQLFLKATAEGRAYLGVIVEVYCGRKVGEREPIRVGARSGVQLMDRWR